MKRKLVLTSAVVLILALLAAGTFAYFTKDARATNVITTGTIDITLNDEIRGLYGEIMSQPAMLAYNTTKNELDRLLNFIQQIVVYSANGEDPFTIQEETSCGGDCSGCSGCH